MTSLKNILDHPCMSETFLELSNKWVKPQVRERCYSPFSISHIFQCPTQLPAFIAPELQVHFYFFYIPKVSTPYELSFLPLNLHIQSFHIDKIKSRLETRWRSVCLWVLHTFMLKCVLQYFDNFLFETFWEF